MTDIEKAPVRFSFILTGFMIVEHKMETVDGDLLSFALAKNGQFTYFHMGTLIPLLRLQLHLSAQMADFTLLTASPTLVIVQFFQIECIRVENHVDISNIDITHVKYKLALLFLHFFLCRLFLRFVALECIQNELVVGWAVFRLI